MPEETVNITISIQKKAYGALLESFDGIGDEKKLNLHSTIKINGLNGAKQQAMRYYDEKLQEKIAAKDFAGCEVPSSKKDLVDKVADTSKFNGEAKIRAKIKAKSVAEEKARRKKIEAELKAEEK